MKSPRNLLPQLNLGKILGILARPRSNKSTMEALLALIDAGAQVRGHPWVHAKGILVDTEAGWEGLVMTSNVEEMGLIEDLRVGFNSWVRKQAT